MKLAVIGSRGFLGSRIAAYYSGKCELFTPTHVELDITDRACVARYLEGVRPDVVIQCAAVSDTGACEKEPEWSRRINVEGSVNVAEAAGHLGANCILCSSDQVYFGSPVQTPHTEDEVLSPGNEYGRQKLTMEQRCLEKNPNSVLLRLSWMYDGKRREGEHGSFLPTLLENLNRGGELSFPVYDRRGITDVTEVVKNLDKAIRLPGGVYNFGAGNDHSTYETMVQVLSRARPEALSRLRENTLAFADRPRNLAMSGETLETVGIRFDSTEEGLIRALLKNS